MVLTDILYGYHTNYWPILDIYQDIVTKLTTSIVLYVNNIQQYTNNIIYK